MARHIVFVHGMGTLAFKAAKSFEKNVAAEVSHMNVTVHTFWWKELVSKQENKIQKVLGGIPRNILSFSLNIKEAVETYLIARIRHLLIGYFGDAVFYISDGSKKVKSQLGKILLEIAKQDPKAEISLVSHSLGSVIAFDLLTDKAFAKRIAKKEIVIENLFTVGSPLALFLLRPGIKSEAKLPLKGRWINIYDKRDVIASQLKPFFSQCKDVHIKVHDANALSAHLHYFDDPIVLNEILRAI